MGFVVVYANYVICSSICQYGLFMLICQSENRAYCAPALVYKSHMYYTSNFIAIDSRPVSYLLPSYGEGGWKEGVPLSWQEEEKV